MIHELTDVLGYWMVRAAAWVVQRLPLNAALALGRGIGRGIYSLSSRRRVAYINLKAAFPESSPRQRKQWTQDLFQHLGMCGIEVLRFPILRKEDMDQFVQIDPEEYSAYLRYRNEQRGLILLTAHLGNWELSQIREGIYGHPLTVLARKQKYKRLDGLLNSYRESFGSVSLGKEKGGIRDFIRCLRRGDCVGVLADQSGGSEGVWVRFFGRLTTCPRGPIVLALEMGIPVLPAFTVRREGPYHRLCFETKFEFVRTGDVERDIQVNTQNYVHLLESYLRQYPSQWLWGHKRWKRTRTKRLVLLSDGKAGHVKQSEAVAREILELGETKVPPYEIEFEKIEVRFRGSWHKKFFPLFAFFFMPWAQGHLTWLGLFLTAETAERVERAHADWVISAGASLVPLNLCLVRENLAKSIVLMKPSFPFNFFRYDLVFIPAHDRGRLPAKHFRTQGALNRIDPETLEASRRLLVPSIQNPQRVRFGLFLGGEIRNFRPSLSDAESLMREVERLSEKWGVDFLLTTSRRTPADIEEFLRRQVACHPRCQLCVIASQDPRPEVVPGMMALADFLIVTEDSLSMISEALTSGKNVVVVKMTRNGLPKKHSRFQKKLKEWGVPVVEIKHLGDVLGNDRFQAVRERMERERVQIREKLECLF